MEWEQEHHTSFMQRVVVRLTGSALQPWHCASLVLSALVVLSFPTLLLCLWLFAISGSVGTAASGVFFCLLLVEGGIQLAYCIVQPVALVKYPEASNSIRLLVAIPMVLGLVEYFPPRMTAGEIHWREWFPDFLPVAAIALIPLAIGILRHRQYMANALQEEE